MCWTINELASKQKYDLEMGNRQVFTMASNRRAQPDGQHNVRSIMGKYDKNCEEEN